MSEPKQEVQVMVEYAVALVPCSQGQSLAKVLTDTGRQGWEPCASYGSKMPGSPLAAVPPEDCHVVVFKRYIEVPIGNKES